MVASGANDSGRGRHPHHSEDRRRVGRRLSTGDGNRPIRRTREGHYAGGRAGSWEISCDLCHTTAGISVATDILRKHDPALHGTNLEKPEAGSLRQLPQTGAADPARPHRSARRAHPVHAMHGSHASRMAGGPGERLLRLPPRGSDDECAARRSFTRRDELVDLLPRQDGRRWATSGQTAVGGRAAGAAIRLPPKSGLPVRAGGDPLPRLQGPPRRPLRSLPRQPARHNANRRRRTITFRRSLCRVTPASSTSARSATAERRTSRSRTGFPAAAISCLAAFPPGVISL